MSLKSRSGFTLMELMVALCCASILMVSAWNVYGAFQRCISQLAFNYSRESAGLLQQLRDITKNARGDRERSSNRF